jgi:transcription initiation factor TFIID subunit 5
MFALHSPHCLRSPANSLYLFHIRHVAPWQARLWDVQSGRNVSVYRGPALWPMWDVAFSPMGHYFATASYSRTAMLWVTTQPQPVRLLVGHYSDVSCVTWHPNCNYVATGSWDKSARLWDVLTGKCVRVFNGHVGPLSSITFSPDGKYVAAAASGATAAGSTIRVWDITSGREVGVLEGQCMLIIRVQAVELIDTILRMF